MKLTKQESELIQFIRTLDFDDMLNVLDGIKAVAEDLSIKSYDQMGKDNIMASVGFESQAEKMTKLEQLLGDANEEYRKEIYSVLEEGE
ncbi:hypothetical protein [Paenibacillus brasilensis]|uniref:Phage protein n=1 Tax=Paenibacillus brasilensis TaxID=128574 RepID=A0ABU0KX47_9BACL|nr:hypothetical protein [Paenibacillus brasilensis]MDQ0494017.1 hypothetical protein [Paenibacillus brasilensis]